MQIFKFHVDADFFASDYYLYLYNQNENIKEEILANANWIHDSNGITAVTGEWERLRDYLDVTHIPYTKENVTSEYERWITNAPQAYDYDYVLNLGDLDGKSRIIAIPASHSEYQVGRYFSGLFSAERK